MKEVTPADHPGQHSGRLASQVIEAATEKENLTAQLGQCRKELEELLPWGHFGKDDMEKLKQCGLKLHFYKSKVVDPAWKEQYALNEIATVGGETYFVVVSDADDFEFPIKELPALEHDSAAVEQEIATLEKSIAEKRKQMLAAAKQLDFNAAALLRDEMLLMEDRMQVISGNLYIITKVSHIPSRCGTT